MKTNRTKKEIDQYPLSFFWFCSTPPPPPPPTHTHTHTHHTHTHTQIEYPVYWTTDEFCDGFIKLMDHLQLDKVCNPGYKYVILPQPLHLQTIDLITCVCIASIWVQKCLSFHVPNFVCLFIRYIYLEPLWEHFWLRRWLKGRTEVHAYTHCFSVMVLLIQQRLDKQKLQRRKQFHWLFVVYVTYM